MTLQIGKIILNPAYPTVTAIKTRTQISFAFLPMSELQFFLKKSSKSQSPQSN